MKEVAKNYIIILLFLSLIIMTVLNWGSWSNISFDMTAETGEEQKQESFINVTRPISGDYDRYSIFLGDFITVADRRADIAVNEWNSALSGGGIHFELLNTVPVWLFAEGLGTTASDIFRGVWVKEIILYEEGLLTFDGKAYARFSVPLSISLPEQLKTEDSDDDNNFPLATVSNRFLDEPYRSELLEALGFNPNSNSKYLQADGEWVFVDNARTLHLSPDGRVVYHDGTRDVESVQIDERAAINLCLAALPKGTAFWGDGNLVFNTVTENDGNFYISLDYVLNDAVFIEGQTVFMVKDGVLREAVIYLSPASLTDETVKLMPKERAMVLISPGKKLCIGYRKSEGGLWSPEWYGY